jgi:hypothetical protein
VAASTSSTVSAPSSPVGSAEAFAFVLVRDFEAGLGAAAGGLNSSPVSVEIASVVRTIRSA